MANAENSAASRSSSANAQPLGARPSGEAMSRDEYLRKVQQTLNGKGYDAGKVDGKWGPRTSAALRKFQGDHGIEATGRIDAQTITALGITQPAPATTTGAAESPSKVASRNSSSSSSAQ
jgi:peptidoglycan hydrolase-like protein with peptidoglycan-binding domain